MKKLLFVVLLLSLYSVSIGLAQADDWVVEGRVMDDLDQAMGGLTVSAYDKDPKKDDPLGFTTTDSRGNFRIVYRTQDFRDTKNERSPHLYLTVSDRKGAIIYSSENRVRENTGRREWFNIRIQTKKELKFKPKIYKPQIVKPGLKIK